jgi:hypothetical protein
VSENNTKNTNKSKANIVKILGIFLIGIAVITGGVWILDQFLGLGLRDSMNSAIFGIEEEFDEDIASATASITIIRDEGAAATATFEQIATDPMETLTPTWTPTSEPTATTSPLAALITRHQVEMTTETAVELATYLNEHVQGEEAWFDVDNELVGNVQIGWDQVEKKWQIVTDENRENIDFTLDSMMPSIFAGGRTTEDGRDVIVMDDGEEVVLEKDVLPGIGEVSLAELVLMGRNRELVFEDSEGTMHTGLTLEEYAIHLMMMDKGETELTEALLKRLSENYPSGTYALGVVLDKGYYQDDGEIMQYPFVINTGNVISTQSNRLLWPVVAEQDDQAKVLTWLRVVQGTGALGFMHQYSVDESGEGVSMDGVLGEADRRNLGNRRDFGKNPRAILLQPDTVAESLDRVHGRDATHGPGVLSDPEISELIQLDPEEALLFLEKKEARLLIFYGDLIIVDR